MTLNKLVVAGLAVAALMLPPFAALAQETPAEGEPAFTEGEAPTEAAAAEAPERPPQENWLKVCEPLEDGQRACIMRQVVVLNNQFLGSFVLRDDPGQESRLFAVAAVPLGVLLPFNLLWQIDNSKPIRVPYITCDPRSCATQLVINEAFVNSLKKGGVLKLIAKRPSTNADQPIQDLVVEINLAGFTAVYDAEEALTMEQYNQQNTGAAALEQQLEDRAEQLRRQLAGEGAAPAEGTTPAPQ
jgi:invasion protein IalB